MTESSEISTDVGSRAVVRSDSASLIAMIIDAARDPAVDADKVKTMADLAMTLQDREREAEFNRAMNAAIKEMPIITKDGKIIVKNKDTGATREQGRFARYEDIDRVVKPIAARHGLAYFFEIGGTGGKVTVRPIVSHSNGHTYRGEAMELPAQAVSPGMNVMQAVGAGSQYGKRYQLCAVFDISTEGTDTDGRVTDTLPFEREQTVLFEAEAAAKAGTYGEFYQRQSPKDRAWLVRSRHHERLGGVQPQIEHRQEAKSEPARQESKPAAKAEPTLQPEQTQAPAEKVQRTPLQMVEDYEARLDACKDHEALEEITGDTAVARWLAKLSKDLNARAIEAERNAARRIDDAEAR